MKRKKQGFIVAECCVLLAFLASLDTVKCIGIQMCNTVTTDPATTIVLNINKTGLQGYRGTCNCTLRSVNLKTKVTATTNVITQKPNTDCAEVSRLTMTLWNYTSCVNPVQTRSVILDVNTTVNISLNVTNFWRPKEITGNISFTSTVSIAVRCYGANYTTTPMPSTTTVPVPSDLSILRTVISAALIVFGGFIVLLIPVTLCVRFRDKRNRDHDTELANLKQIIPDMEKDKVDPKMVNYSWLKTLTLRLLKRFYNNEGRQRRSRSGGRSARGLSEARNERTGSQARKRFQSLFKKRSTRSTSSSSIKSQSNISDQRVEAETKPEHNGLNDISMQQGGGIFMDAKSRYDVDMPNEEDSTQATVHSNLPIVRENNGTATKLGTEYLDGYQDCPFDDGYERMRPNTPPADYEDVKRTGNGVGNIANGHPPELGNKYAVVNKTK